MIDKEDVARVTVQAADALQISGETAWEGAPPDNAGSAQIQFFIQAVTNDAMPAPSAKPSIPAQFTFTALPAVEYAVRPGLIFAGGLPNAYIRDIVYGRLSILHEVLKPAPDSSVRVVLGNDGGFLKATVTGKDRQPAPGARVFLMPADAASEAILADSLISGPSDSAGSYTSTAVSPGKYLAIATTDLVDNTPESIDRIWQARNRATPIDIGPSANAQATLEITPLE
jgi:hypothetical protein